MKTEDIYKLAELAKIEITEQEAESLLGDINGILGHVSRITELGEVEVESKYKFHSIARPDQYIEEDFSKEIIQENVRDLSKDGYVKVAKVIKK